MDFHRQHSSKTHHQHQHRLPAPPLATSSHHQHQHHHGQRHKLCNKISFKLFMSEFFGTFIFVFLGQSTLASFELVGTQNDTISRQLASILTYGSAYLFAIILTLNLSGAHLNPAYSLASATYGYLKWGRALNYICAQYLGAFVASFFLHVTYSDKLTQRHTEGLLTGINSTLRAHGSILSTGKLFSSYPPTEVSLTQLAISYVLASSHLMLILLAIQESKLINMPQCIKPIYMAAALILIQAAFSANGGPVLNPAQDFSPRFYISLCGWGLAAFNLYHFNYWWICGIIAPNLGAFIGFGLYQMLAHLNDMKGARGADERARVESHDVEEHEYSITQET